MIYGFNKLRLTSKWSILALHAAVWGTLAISAYHTAGPYRFASCWQIIPLLLPPLNMMLLGIAIASLVMMLASVVRPAMRKHAGFFAACNGMVLVIGLIGCNYSAYLAAGQVSCL
ncbi:hypothetical protein FHT77_000321 [Rhizobium sp. BK181]|uniref:hypothetical protein n=1 Tax=Rhizobium sp. BK181 TaxID=2587072 RepID=UPI001614A6E0|nr:hypothetical protein [Rhizobium sp. BK181]MBB3314479.1 hypothetical protein [Rhizobium sp. BK181]